MKRLKLLVPTVVALASLLIIPPAIAEDHGEGKDSPAQTVGVGEEGSPAEPGTDPEREGANPLPPEGATQPGGDTSESTPTEQSKEETAEAGLDEDAPPLPARAVDGIVQPHGPVIKVREFALTGGAPEGTLFPIGNWDGQGLDDYARVEANGDLTFFARLNEDSLSAGRRIGVGWNVMRDIHGGADFDGDGAPDLIAIDQTQAMYLYRGDGRGGFGIRSRIGAGWGVFPHVRLIADGPNHNPAILAENDEGAVIYGTNGRGQWAARQAARFPFLETLVGGPDVWRTGYSMLASVATDTRVNLYSSDDGIEYNPSGHLTFSRPFSKVLGAVPGKTPGTTVLDLLMRDGTLFSVVIKGDGVDPQPEPEPEPEPSPEPPAWESIRFHQSFQSGVGWPSTDVYFMGDFDGDGSPDAAIMWSDGRLVLYPSQGVKTFGAQRQIGRGWNVMRDFHTGVDFDGDGSTDILARTQDGALLLYPGDGRGGFKNKRQVGRGWQVFDRVFLLRQGPNKHPIIYGLAGASLTAYSTYGNGQFGSVKTVPGDYGWLLGAYASDDWNNSGMSDLLYRDDRGYLYVAPQDRSYGFPSSTMHRIGTGWTGFTPILPAAFEASNKVIWTVDPEGKLRTYYFRHSNGKGQFIAPKVTKPQQPKIQTKSYRDGSWLRHPIAWKGQPDDETCGPTSMWMVLNYLDAHRSAYDGKPLDVWTLKGRDYANVGTGFSGGTSWEESRLSVGMNRWLGKNVYKQWTFPSGWDFRFKVIDSFKTGRPVVVDTIENYGGPHYNGHVGRSSHIIVANEYHAHNGAIGFVDPGGPGSAISGYSAQRYFRYPSAIEFGTNFLGNYGGGGHGMVY